MGDLTEFAELRGLIDTGLELSDRRKQRLRGGAMSAPMIGRLVCACSQVGDGSVAAAIESGRLELAELRTLLGTGLACGSSKREIRRLMESRLVSAV